MPYSVIFKRRHIVHLFVVSASCVMGFRYRILPGHGFGDERGPLCPSLSGLKWVDGLDR